MKAVISHVYDATPEELFEAFTNPEVLKNWYAPEGLSIPEVTADAKVGGKHRVVMQAPDGKQHIANGVYREVIPGKKLVYTWKWEAGDMSSDDTLITVEFKPKGDKTEVLMIHEGLPSEKEVQMHTQGWASCLMKLEKII